MKLIKSPLIEERLELEDSGRAKELRSLWLRLGTIEDRNQLEALWPAMKGRWFGEFGLPPKTDPGLPEMERITNRIQSPDDPHETAKQALARIRRQMKNVLPKGAI